VAPFIDRLLLPPRLVARMADDVHTAATAASRVGDLASAIRDRIPSMEDGLSSALGVAESVDQRLDAIEHRLAILDTMPDEGPTASLPA